jgi:hypothetical protein
LRSDRKAKRMSCTSSSMARFLEWSGVGRQQFDIDARARV